MAPSRPFCSDVSLENAEPLAGTASRVDHWILLEYRGLWSKDAVAGSGLSDQVKRHLREQTSARPNTKLLFIRRTERRGHPQPRRLLGKLAGARRRALPHRDRGVRGCSRPRPDIVRRPARSPAAPRLHARQARPRAARATAGRSTRRSPSSPRTTGSGRSRTSAATASRAISSRCRTASTSGA